MRHNQKDVLSEGEIRSIVQSELKRLISERSGMGRMELSFIAADAMLDGLRDVAISAASNQDVKRAVQSLNEPNDRKLAEMIVSSLFMNDNEFRTDLVSLIASMIKRAR